MFVVALFSLLSPSFLAKYNALDLLLRNTHMIILTVGLSLVIAGGWIDLSVGYQLSFISVLVGWLLNMGVQPLAAGLLGVLAGLLCGAFNGFLVTVLGLAPFAATLASQVIFRGFSYTITNGSIFSHLPESFRKLTQGRLLGIPVDVWIALACLLAASLLFAFTYYGKYIKAIGANEEAVRRSGVNIRLVKMLCYMLCSTFCAMAALVMTSQYGRATSYNGAGIEITAITAVYLSGAVVPHTSKRGSGYHSWLLVLGVLVLATVEEGVKLVGWNPFIRYIIMGAILAWAFTRAGH